MSFLGDWTPRPQIHLYTPNHSINTIYRPTCMAPDPGLCKVNVESLAYLRKAWYFTLSTEPIKHDWQASPRKAVTGWMVDWVTSHNNMWEDNLLRLDTHIQCVDRFDNIYIYWRIYHSNYYYNSSAPNSDFLKFLYYK